MSFIIMRFNIYKLTSNNVGPPHPKLIWLPLSLEPATQQRSFDDEVETLLLLYFVVLFVFVDWQVHLCRLIMALVIGYRKLFAIIIYLSPYFFIRCQKRIDAIRRDYGYGR